MATETSPRTGLLELGAILAVAALLAAIHFLVPESTQQLLAFDHDRFAVYTLFTAGYIHLSNAHLLGNVVGYLIAALYTYMLCAAVDERRWFRRTFVVLLLAMSVLVNLASYAIFAVQYPSADVVSRGFSGVVAGFGGFLLVALAVYVEKRWSGQLGWMVGVSSFLLLMTVIDFIYAGGLRVTVVGLVLAGIVLLVGSYVWESDVDVGELDERRMAKDVGAVVLVFGVLVYMILSLFPSGIVEDGHFTNIFAHAIGFLVGIALSSGIQIFWE